MNAVAADRPLRFLVSAIDPEADWPGIAAEAERLDYDLLATTDHLGMTAPFPSLVAAAAATTRLRVATYLVNTALWDPEVLAREVAGTDRITGGRLEVGLHSGQTVSARTAHLDATQKLARLTDTVETLQRLLPDPGHRPRPLQHPRPPLLLGADDPAELELAARHADTVCFIGASLPPGGGFVLHSPEEFARRVATVRERAAQLGRDPELNVGVKRIVVTGDRRAAAEALRESGFAAHLSTAELLELPTLLIGTHRQIAGQVRAHRERYGLTSYALLATALHDFAPVIPLLRKG